MPKAIIELNDIHKNYGNHQALTQINLQVQNSEFLTLLGPSGCGKTTLLRLISGFEKPDQGSITIKGQNAANLPPEKRHVNMVFQSYALFPHLTVFENVAFGLRCQNLPQYEINTRVQETLAMVKLADFTQRKPKSLSGGQQQRVAIARAVVNQPWVLLLDEPMSALDYRLRKTMQIELKQLQRRLGITFIHVTHDQEEALSMSDRIVVMNNGSIEQIGPPRDIYEEPCNLFVTRFVGEANIFPCQISKANEKSFTAVIEGKLFQFENSKNYMSGQNINIIIRPEDIRVWGKSEIKVNAKMLAATVEQVIYKGSTVDLVVRLESGKLISATEFFDEDDENLEYDVGERVWIEWMHGWEVVLSDKM